MSNANSTTQKYGLPFDGYQSSVRRNFVPRNRVAVGSQNAMFNPLEGKFYKRQGSQTVFDAFGALVGLAETKFNPRARQIIRLSTGALLSGYSSLAVLLTNEATFQGQIVFRDTNGGGSNRVIAQSFASEYPQGGATNPFTLKALPYWSEHPQRVGRLVTKTQRTFTASGSRQMLAAGGYLIFPNVQGVPSKWNKQWYDGVLNPAPLERFYPLGHLPPAVCPHIQVLAASTNGDESWTAKDRFFYSVMYEHFDGSFSMPFIPRPPSAIACGAAAGTEVKQNLNGYVDNLIRAGQPNTEVFESIVVVDIPTGGPDVRARWLLRSPKVPYDGTTNIPNLADLRLWEYIPNNTATSWVSYNGNDAGLKVDAVNIRFDHIMPYSARYISQFDQRLLLAYLKISPLAVVITQRFVKGGGALARPNDWSALVTGSAIASFAIRHGQTTVGRPVSLVLIDNQAAVTNEQLFNIANYSTLQALIDAVNTTNPSSTAGDWKCQPLPGADVATAPASLDVTQSVVKCVANGTSTLSCAVNQGDGANGDFTTTGYLRSGMAITGGTVPAATYVGTITNSTTLTAVDATGAPVNIPAGTNDLKFGYEYGDLNAGEQRDFGTGMPGLIFWSKTYRDAQPVEKLDVIFTGGGPGHAQGHLAIDSFYAGVNGTKRTMEDYAGICTGVGTLLSGAAVLFSHAVGVLRNVKGGKSGEDVDYRLEAYSKGDGCISPASVIEGHGWVGYLKRQGYVVFDGDREVMLSGAIWNPGSDNHAGAGEWAYEIGQCIAACDGDTDGAMLSAMVSNAAIWITYRSSNAVTYPDRMIVYDFSPTAENVGVGQVAKISMNPNMATTAPQSSYTPYGWSAPMTLRISVMVQIPASTGGFLLYGAVDDGDGNKTTGSGRIDQFNVSTGANQWKDNGTAYQGLLYMATDEGDAAQKKSPKLLYAKYRNLNAAALNLKLATDQNRTAFDTLTLPGTGTSLFSQKMFRPNQRMRAAKQSIEWVLDDLSVVGSWEFWGVEMDADLLIPALT